MTSEHKIGSNRKHSIIRALTWIGQRAPFLVSLWAALVFYSAFASQEISWQLLAFSIRFDLLPQTDLAKYMSYLAHLSNVTIIIGFSAIWVAICVARSARKKADNSSRKKGEWFSIMNPYIALSFCLLCIFLRNYTTVLNNEWLSSVYNNNQVFLAIRNGLVYGAGKSFGFTVTVTSSPAISNDKASIPVSNRSEAAPSSEHIKLLPFKLYTSTTCAVVAEPSQAITPLG